MIFSMESQKELKLTELLYRLNNSSTILYKELAHIPPSQATPLTEVYVEPCFNNEVCLVLLNKQQIPLIRVGGCKSSNKVSVILPTESLLNINEERLCDAAQNFKWKHIPLILTARAFLLNLPWVSQIKVIEDKFTQYKLKPMNNMSYCGPSFQDEETETKLTKMTKFLKEKSNGKWEWAMLYQNHPTHLSQNDQHKMKTHFINTLNDPSLAPNISFIPELRQDSCYCEACPEIVLKSERQTSKIYQCSEIIEVLLDKQTFNLAELPLEYIQSEMLNDTHFHELNKFHIDQYCIIEEGKAQEFMMASNKNLQKLKEKTVQEYMLCRFLFVLKSIQKSISSLLANIDKQEENSKIYIFHFENVHKTSYLELKCKAKDWIEILNTIIQLWFLAEVIIKEFKDIKITNKLLETERDLNEVKEAYERRKCFSETRDSLPGKQNQEEEEQGTMIKGYSLRKEELQELKLLKEDLKERPKGRGTKVKEFYDYLKKKLEKRDVMFLLKVQSELLNEIHLRSEKEKFKAMLKDIVDGKVNVELID